MGSCTRGALPVLLPLGLCTQARGAATKAGHALADGPGAASARLRHPSRCWLTGRDSGAGCGASAHRPSIPFGPDRRGPCGWHGTSVGFWKQRVKPALSNLAPKGQPPAPEAARRPKIATARQGRLALRDPGALAEPSLGGCSHCQGFGMGRPSRCPCHPRGERSSGL